MSTNSSFSYANRELSWLSFNERVLQEAEDPTVPLFERLNFLAIYSSNLDEYFRVRVASLRNLLRLSDKSLEGLEFKPANLLRKIQKTVQRHNERIADLWRNEIAAELKSRGIHLINEHAVTDAQRQELESYFDREIRPHIEPKKLQTTQKPPFLKNQQLYLVTEIFPQRSSVPVFSASPDLVLVPIPTERAGRFKVLSRSSGEHYVIFLDDVIRLNLPRLFPGARVGGSYSLTLSRDAEVYLEDEFSGNLIDKIREGVEKRDLGRPCRFLYDPQTPFATISFLRNYFDLEGEDLVQGGRYHNLRDLFHFPRFALDELTYAPRPPVGHPDLEEAASIFDPIREEDRLLVFPYHSFTSVLRFLEEAARDASVRRLWISLYRLSQQAPIIEPLITAAQNGVEVTVFIEAKARFNEAANLSWAERLEKQGVNVLYSIPGLKVHAKMALVERREASGRQRYAYLSTGNFNEVTARQFSDVGLFTAQPRVTRDVRRLFGYLTTRDDAPELDRLVVSPFDMRERWEKLIGREIKHARQGHRAQITLKLNSLTDQRMIDRLYEASNNGVSIRVLVRGICRLIPGVEGQSEHIESRSIIDRYLEHARIFSFYNRGNPTIYAASADWMERNLDRRIEVAFPITDEDVRKDLQTVLELQWADNTKARRIDRDQTNSYVSRDGKPRLRSQMAIYEYFREKHEGPTA